MASGIARFNGKIAIVTGAAQGIGRAIATHTGNAVTTHAAARTKIRGSVDSIRAIERRGKLHGRGCQQHD